MGRAFDPANLGLVDQGWFPDEADEDFAVVETCPICGAQDLVRADGLLVDLEGEEHACEALP